MIKRNALNFRPARILIYIILIIGSFIFIFPYIWMIISSFKSLGEINTFPPTILPDNPTMGNYRIALFDIGFGRFFINSLIISIIKTGIILYTSTLIGYILGKIKFVGRQIIFIFILMTIMIPWPVMIVPLYDLMVKFDWLNNYAALIIPFALNSFGIFLMKQFTASISDEVIEYAEIDGASQFRIFHKIILPLMSPAISALGIFVFLFTWDDLLWPYLVLQKTNLYTLPLGLALLKGSYFNETGAVLAGSTITMIPVIIVFLFAQRRFIEGMAFTGIK